MKDTTRRNKNLLVFINFTILAFLVSGFVLLAIPRDVWPSFYSPVFFGVASLVSAFVLAVPKYIFKTKDSCQNEVLLFLRGAIAIALILNGLGELYFYQLYKYGFQYDKFIHLFLPFLSVVVLPLFIEVMYGLTIKKATIISVILVLSGGLAWELFEFLSDYFFKTSEFGIYGLFKFSDTVFDLIFDALGVFFGVIYLKNGKFYHKITSKHCSSGAQNVTL